MKLLVLCEALFLFGSFVLNDAAVSSDVTLKRANRDTLLMQRMMAVSTINPSYTQPCFQTYMPLFNSILQDYSKSLELCSSMEEQTDVQLSDQSKGNRTLISNESTEVCNTMIKCSSMDQNLPFFDCYSNVGNGNVRSIYDLTNLAINVAAYIREEMQVVQYNLNKCQNISEQKYAEGEMDTNEALEYCFMHGPPQVATDAPTSTADSGSSASTPSVTVGGLIQEVMAPPADSDYSDPQLRVLAKYSSLIKKHGY